MNKYITDLYVIRTLSNLHAGSGDTNYGIVDKQVQRDPVEELPVIHSSGLKGAFRELFADFYSNSNDPDHKANEVVHIFGSDSKRDEAAGLQSGSYKFFDARLLALPARSNVFPYCMATSVERLLQFKNDINLFESGFKSLHNAIDTIAQATNIKEGKPVLYVPDKTRLPNNYNFVDEWNVDLKNKSKEIEELENLLGENICLMHHKDLKELAAKLPVIARNKLDNGISENLWYEEVVPKESRFYFLVSHPDLTDANGLAKFNDLFNETLKKTQINHLVQIGGSSSVGYGLCKLYKL